MSAFGGKVDIAAKLLTRDERGGSRRISPSCRSYLGRRQTSGVRWS